VQKYIIPDILKYVGTIGGDGQVFELSVSAAVVYNPKGTYWYDVAWTAKHIGQKHFRHN